MLTEAFGVKGQLGDLCLTPKLVAEQFGQSDRLSVQTVFAGKKLTVIYHNQKHLSYGDYQIGSLSVNGRKHDLQAGSSSIQFPRQEVLSWLDDVEIVVNLI